MSAKCPKCENKYQSSKNNPKSVSRYGSFYRQSDRKKVLRFFCKRCELTFSVATRSSCFGQKKRHFNHRVARILIAGVSQRECARILRLNKKTVVRKFLFMAHKAQIKNEELNRARAKVRVFEFDDLESFEYTKCKPISVVLAVEEKTRWILGYEVASMPAKGLLAKRALKKYGYRIDERASARTKLFKRIKELTVQDVVIKSDLNPHYKNDVEKFFPQSLHLGFKGRKAAVVGQGELKRGGFDPIFSLNHTLAMSRYRMSRLIRKTWCTTKKKERIGLHFALMSLYHNLSLVKSTA